LTAGLSKRIFVTDCEGPISKNDNAYKLTCHVIPNGDKFFSLISRYDDVLADVFKRRGYKAGDTLKLVLPFLKAYDVTNQKMKDFASEDIVLVSGAKDTLRFVQRIMPSYIVSTSYEHYISALCKAIDFPVENTYSTRVDVDQYRITGQEKQTLHQLAQEIARMPMVEIPKNAMSTEDFSLRDQFTIKRLDEIFWSVLPRMSLGRIFNEVNPVGGKEKASAVQEIVARIGCSVDCVMYVGDSITDVECFRFVRNGDGLTVSFNGNEYAVREAQVAAMSENTVVTSIIADLFSRYGKDSALKLARDWSLPTLRQSKIDPVLLNRIEQLYTRSPPKVKVVTKDKMEETANESAAFRKKVRGEAIARLG
jgi:energy-converting hydrogenase A subunit R